MPFNGSALANWMPPGRNQSVFAKRQPLACSEHWAILELMLLDFLFGNPVRPSRNSQN